MKKEKIAIEKLKVLGKMKFLGRLIFSKTLGVATAVFLFCCCKADGG